MKKKILALMVGLSLTVTSIAMPVWGESEETAPYKQAQQKTANYLIDKLDSPGYGQEWIILGLARSDAAVPDETFDSYYNDLEQSVKDCGGVLDRRKYTEYSRVILALTAIGKDPADVGGYNLLEKLADFENVIWQGINGPIWALIALDSGDYEIPVVDGVKTQTTRQLLIDEILSQEIDGGGFSLDGRTPDCDITAMALQALASYTDQSKVKAATDRALSVLSSMQKADGTFGSWGTKNSESVSQVLVALAALHIDPLTDERFIRNGNTVIDGLLDFYDSVTGGFRHVNMATSGYEPVVNGMATEQAYYALTAYDRYLAGKTFLYDMSDVEKEAGGQTGQNGRIKEGVKATTVNASSSVGKGYIKITWEKSAGYKVDRYQIFRSKNKNSGYGTKAYFTTQKGTTTSYKNTKELTKGVRYYYKVRGVRVVDGETVYTKYSNVVSRTASSYSADEAARIKAGVQKTAITASSSVGKGYIKITWQKSGGYKVDRYQIFRSRKKTSGYGTKAYYTTQKGTTTSYKNTKGLTKGVRYYYKVRGVRVVDGKTVYTKYSNAVSRVAK